MLALPPLSALASPWLPDSAHPLLQAVEIVQHREEFLDVARLVDVLLPVSECHIEHALLRLRQAGKHTRELVDVEVVELKCESLVLSGSTSRRSCGAAACRP